MPPVTPFAGVWIEIGLHAPSKHEYGVTPFAGVWIEIAPDPALRNTLEVTPFAGVWIEIRNRRLLDFREMSLPLRECGLKYVTGGKVNEVVGHSLMLEYK